MSKNIQENTQASIYSHITCKERVHLYQFMPSLVCIFFFFSHKRRHAEPYLRLAIRRSIHRSFQIVLPVLVVESLLLFVAQHLVCLGNFLESDDFPQSQRYFPSWHTLSNSARTCMFSALHTMVNNAPLGISLVSCVYPFPSMNKENSIHKK